MEDINFNYSDVNLGDFAKNIVLSYYFKGNLEFKLVATEMNQLSEVSTFPKGIDVYVYNQKLDTIAMLRITQRIEKEIENFSPEVIYTHHHGDLNLDHRIVNNATITACRPMPNSSIREIFTFEILSSTDWQAQGENNQFVPNYFNDITKYLEKKIKLLKIYKNEMRKWPHSRSFENVRFLAKTRGATVGCKAAEAFQLVRSINK